MVWVLTSIEPPVRCALRRLAKRWLRFILSGFDHVAQQPEVPKIWIGWGWEWFQKMGQKGIIWFWNCWKFLKMSIFTSCWVLILQCCKDWDYSIWCVNVLEAIKLATDLSSWMVTTVWWKSTTKELVKDNCHVMCLRIDWNWLPNPLDSSWKTHTIWRP